MAKNRRINFRNRPVTFLKLIPNIITIIGLCTGFSAIRFALDSKWEFAVLCTIFASILDGLDGKIARLLNSTSTFGAELDSLCDAINFGVAPVLVTYLWTFNDYSIKVVSWATVLLFTVCMVLRLARFNTMAISASEDKILSGFFIGIPAPAGAILALAPLIHEFYLKEYTNFSFMPHPLIIAVYQCIIGFLMASKLPTYSIKNLSVDPKNLWLWLILSGIAVISIFLYTWVLLPLIALLYIFSLPFSYLSYKKLRDSTNLSKTI